MTDKLLCPFCNKPLQPTFRQSDEYWCENYDCSGTNIEWVGSKKLWQELIRTRKALDVALDWLGQVATPEKCDDDLCSEFTKRKLTEIKTALEQKEHYTERNIDETTGKFLCSDPKLNKIKIRLYDKDRQCTKEYTLSKLIYTKFKRNKFEYRGMSTGLKDKNGNLIYEGDIVKCDRDFCGEGRVGLIRTVVFSDGAFQIQKINKEDRYYINAFHNFEVLGNMHESNKLWIHYEMEQKDVK